MININTNLSVLDNCGAKEIKCIKIFRLKKKLGSIGNLMTVSVQRIRSSKRLNARVKKSDVCFSLIVYTKVFYQYGKIHTHDISFDKNSAVVLNKQYKLIGTRLISPLPFLFRRTKFLKLTFVTLGLLK
jgi:ribosomal protein L14